MDSTVLGDGMYPHVWRVYVQEKDGQGDGIGVDGETDTHKEYKIFLFDYDMTNATF